MIFGVDISRYQPASAMDGYSFVLINAEDPGFNDKVAHARELSIPWGPYTWVYPGNGVADMRRALDVCRPHGDPPMGYWLDYEQAGVSPGDIDAALGEAQNLGVHDRTGVYTYLHVLNDTDVEDHFQGCPLWIAYYPGNNDGNFPPSQIGDANRYGAVMWQYTSGANAAVGLDKNVVINEDWYHTWTGGQGGFLAMLTDQEQAEVLKAARLMNRGVPELGVPGVFDASKSMAQTGVPEYGLPNLFAGQHEIQERLKVIEEKLGIGE